MNPIDHTLAAQGMRPIPPDTRARASLLVWTDIAAEDEARFNEWYNREHMRDRALDLPGFVRARRYVALDGQPKYLALYDATDAEVFSSETYLAMIGRPDPLSQYFITRFENACRTIASIDFSFGEGEGGVLALWELPAEADVDAPDLAQLAGAAQAALACRGAVAIHLLSKNELALVASSRRHVRQGNRIIERALVLEAMDRETLSLCADALAQSLAGKLGRATCFQLLYRVSR